MEYDGIRCKYSIADTGRKNNRKSGSTSQLARAYAGREGMRMCVRRKQLGLLLIGLGLGLLLSFVLCGWFWRILAAIALFAAGLALAL